MVTTSRELSDHPSYLLNIEHVVTTPKIKVLSLLPQECMSIYELNLCFIFARAIPVKAKLHFKILQFLAVTYAIGVLSCAFDVVKTAVFSLYLSNF